MMNNDNKKSIALFDYIPIDLLFLCTSLKFDKHYYNILKICSKEIYEKFKNDSWEKWDKVNPVTLEIKNLITSGYRNFKINNYEFFVVNAKITKIKDVYKYCLYTSRGEIITLQFNGFASNFSTFTRRINQIECLVNGYPFSAFSRKLSLTNT